MSTHAEVTAYYAEIEAMKHQAPSAQTEAFVSTLRQDDERPDTNMPGHAHTNPSSTGA